METLMGEVCIHGRIIQFGL